MKKSKLIVALTNSIADYLNPGTTTGGTNTTAAPNDKLFVVIKKMRALNKTASPVTVSAFIGATGASAAGTEFGWSASVIPANDSIEFDCNVPLTTTAFLTALASANTSVTLEVDYEIGVA